MSDFRKVLDAHVRGQATLADAEQALQESLEREAGLAAAHGALIEALYRGERLSAVAYAALMKRLGTLQPARQSAAPRAPAATEGDDDKTIFRVRPAQRPLPQQPPPSSQLPPSQPDTSQDKTILRVPPSNVNVTSRNTTSASSWSHPSHWTPTDSAPPGPGSVIKDRFELVEKIGQGGMGTVYKARDRRKEEAQDRNPYVALKVLNEDFRRHPRSLQALQREARKAQALQHPNIVTVYDFDRDGTNVYLVMELLEGEPLDRLIKRHKGVGLEARQAWDIARQICKGMGYAHGQGIVHADFKPANAYLLKDGTVKIFDFGIARAVKHGTRGGGEFTTFDPGTLGALTPAYASREVALGNDPDASDDVYAIACVIYELLTGMHPYNSIAADVASTQGLVVPRPARLSWLQWRTLRAALGFSREQRPATAKVLLDSFFGRRKPPVLYASVAVAAAVVLTGAVMLISSRLAAAREQEVSAALVSADARRIEAAIPLLRDLDPSRQATIFLDETARAGLIRHFERRIEESVNTVAGRYDFPAAEAQLAELASFFPDSQAVTSISDRLRARKQEELERYTREAESAIQQGVLTAAQGSPSLSSALAAVRAIDPRHALLIDERFPAAFASQVRTALGKSDTALAAQLVEAGLSIDPGDSALTRLQDEVRAVRAAQAEAGGTKPGSRTQVTTATAARAENSSATEIAPADMSSDQLRASIAAGLEKRSRTLAEARSLATLVTELGAREADTAAEFKRSLKLKLAGDATTVRRREGAEAAIRFAEGAYALYPDSPVLRKSLTRLRLEAAETQAEQREIDLALAKRKLNALMDDRSVLEDSWPQAVEAALERVASSVAPDDIFVKMARIRIAVLYLTRAATSRQAGRLEESARMLQGARTHGASAAAIAAEERFLVQAQATQQVEQAVRDRAAQIESTKQRLLAQARANEVVDALATLDALRATLPKRDPFITEQAPAAIASAYLRVASTAAREGRLADAISLVSRGRSLSRATPDITRALKRYERYKDIEGELTEDNSIDVPDILSDFSRFAKEDAEEEAAVARWMIRKVVTRANTTPNVKTATRLSAIARQLSEHQASLGDAPAADVPAVLPERS
jgi:predicted Ser/Thr protein kinase